MKVVLQDGIKDCGICCLLSVIRYYGGDVSKEYLREITSTNKSGVSAYNLIEGARKIGFNADGMRGDLSNITKNNLPCLAHVIVNKSYKHFVVIYDINFNTNKVLIMDPAKGKVVLSISEFKLLSTMNYIFLKPSKALPTFNKNKVINKILINFLKRNKLYIFIIVILTMLYFLLQILTAFHFKYLLEFAINYKLSDPIIIISSVMFILHFFKALASLLRNFLLNKIIAILDIELTYTTFKQILLLPYLYYKNRTTGEVISRMRELNTIKNYLAQVFCLFFSDFLGLFIFSLIMYKLNRRLWFWISVICILFLIIQLIFNKFRKKKIKKANYYNDKVNSYLVEAISNIDSIKGSHLEKRISDTFKLKYQTFLEKNYDLNILSEWHLSIKNFLENILLILIFGLGSYLVVIGKMSLGGLIIYQSIFNYYLFCFSNLLSLESSYHDFKIALNRVEDLFTIRRDNFLGNYYYLTCKLDGDIKFSNLNYSFGRKDLFNNLNLIINYQDKVLLLGESGSGKSTLVKMLMRYIEIPFGMLKINNIDINHYHLDILRKNITYVSNFDSLFTDTLYNNIVLNKEISEEEFKEIVKITRVEEIIKDDNLGYQVMIEENGFNFSNGERQRIILARALVRKSDIYIFDEAFSQIDLDKTKVILNDLLKYLKDKTIIVISHRNNFKKVFNRVLKLEKGVINEVT